MATAVTKKAEVTRVSGPVVTATGLTSRMYDVVFVGTDGLMGEVIQIRGERTIIQVYEDTSGVKPGEPVKETHGPLQVELGPGCLTSIYDGIQRPLSVLLESMGDFISRGVTVPGLDHKKKWDFTPTIREGQTVHGGQALGTVPETRSITHKVLVPPNVQGRVTKIRQGSYTVDEAIAELDSGTTLKLMQAWPVRKPRPSKTKHRPEIPLVTGTRILDGLFPVAKGGTAAIPGPFGSGKCVTPDTPVLLGDGRLVPIGELHRDLVGARDAGDTPEHLQALEAPLDVVGFDGQALRKAEATHLYRGTADRVIRIRTRTGREVTVTPDHRLFRVGDAAIEETPAALLAPGDFLAAPRKIPLGDGVAHARTPIDPALRCADEELLAEVRATVDELPGTLRKRAATLDVSLANLRNWRTGPNRPPLGFVQRVFTAAGRETPLPGAVKAERDSTVIKVPPLVDAEVAEFLGLLMSEGTIKAGQVAVFYNNDDALLARFGDLAERLFGIRSVVTQERTVKAASLFSRALVRILAGLGMPLRQKSRTVSVPPQVLAGPESVVRAFLRAYIAGDGSVEKRGLEISTASAAMAGSLLYLLARLGIVGRVKHRSVRGYPQHRVFVSPKECAALLPEAYDADPPRFDSFDVVPLSPTYLQAVLHETGYARLKSRGVEIHNYIGGGERLGRTKLAVVSEAAVMLEDLASFTKALESVFCDEIVEITEIPGPQVVFDLVVPETQNFVGGHTPCLLHNTVTQQALAKWSDAEVVVYIGCGERGNEMTEVLTEFPHLEDPKTGNPLMDRTVLIANTSNMPVAAREASVYTGVTIAEYYRDQGNNVALMADSTSRWAEAMREISSRLEEMPGEEGYPAYLAARAAEFYERAGRVTTLNGDQGSVTVIGAVSPPGGDFSEPVTQNTLRIVKVFWALDSKLAQRRHFPAINWLDSYSLYTEALDPWFRENVSPEWPEQRSRAMRVLQQEAELQDIVQLVGSDALPPDQQMTLEVARLYREVFLQQNAFHPVDTYSSPQKTFRVLKTIDLYHRLAKSAMDGGARLEQVVEFPGKTEFAKAKFEANFDEIVAKFEEGLRGHFRGLGVEVGQ